MIVLVPLRLAATTEPLKPDNCAYEVHRHGDVLLFPLSFIELFASHFVIAWRQVAFLHFFVCEMRFFFGIVEGGGGLPSVEAIGDEAE